WPVHLVRDHGDHEGHGESWCPGQDAVLELLHRARHETGKSGYGAALMHVAHGTSLRVGRGVLPRREGTAERQISQGAPVSRRVGGGREAPTGGLAGRCTPSSWTGTGKDRSEPRHNARDPPSRRRRTTIRVTSSSQGCPFPWSRVASRTRSTRSPAGSSWFSR